ncbi:MAG: endonuclease Q family protein [Halanaerobium sp.]|nr:endonuclease Q family protein [Halanaerobium sp.]
MNKYFADLHIHIGADSRGNPVKVTASPNLDLARICQEARDEKGLDIVGIVDCASPGVLADLAALIRRGALVELDKGGFLYQGDTVIFTGSEVELQGPQGPGHFLAYFPFLDQLKEYSRRMDEFITNIQLSSQKAFIEPREWFALVAAIGGRIFPAHAFTPHRSLYGSMASSLAELAPAGLVAGLELGLSADTWLAHLLPETREWAYLSNSDAHSAEKIAREYNLLALEEANFSEFELALSRQKGRGVIANYGLDPRLGKYHRTFCLVCEVITESTPPVTACQRCSSEKVVRGVLDRVIQLAGLDSPAEYNRLREEGLPCRPPYYYQIPLAMVPGIGKKTIGKLVEAFGSEMNVLHLATLDDLKEVINHGLAEKIVRSRTGGLEISAGGGGKYGRVVK